MFLRGSNDAKLKFSDSSPDSRSRTHQSFAKDADINNIMSRYKKTGVLVDPRLISSSRVPRFGDFSDIPDYATVVSRVQQAEKDFMTLPASVRAKFDNDVANALNFISDRANVKESVALGLLPKDNPDYLAVLKEEEEAARKASEGARPEGEPTA